MDAEASSQIHALCNQPCATLREAGAQVSELVRPADFAALRGHLEAGGGGTRK